MVVLDAKQPIIQGFYQINPHWQFSGFAPLNFKDIALPLRLLKLG